MTRYILVSILTLVLVSCKDNPAVKKAKDVQKVVSSTNNIVKQANDIQEKAEYLKSIRPLTMNELKEWLPEKIGNMSQKSYKTGATSMMGVVSIEAKFTSEDKVQGFYLELMDCAGETGASMMTGMRSIFAMDYEEETEYKTKRTVTKNGQRAIIEYNKKSGDSTVETLYNDRFYLKLTANKMSVDDVWLIIKKLDLESLEQ